MADLFLDIRDRHIRAIVSDNEEIRFQRAYFLKAPDRNPQLRGGQSAEHPALFEGELADIIANIRTDAGITLDHAHIILPSADVQRDIHRLPRMSQEDAFKLLTRKTAEKTGDETPQFSLTPMTIEQNSQEWLVEYVPTETLRAYKKELLTARLKLKTVTTALDSTLHAITHIRESIFNADAIFEINDTCIEAYYVSASSLLLHETLPIGDEEFFKNNQDVERTKKRRMFTLLDLLYHVNAQYLASHAMTPLQKVWLCGTDATIAELSTALKEAMDIETELLSSDGDGAFVALKGFWKAYKEGLVLNFMHPDLLRRFPLRKKTGLLVYILTALLSLLIVTTTEYRHKQLKIEADTERKKLTALKLSQTTSAAFVKNLDLLKKLSGSQVMFYPIFKELAMNLPEKVYLDTFSYSSKDNRDVIDISASFDQTSDLGTQKTLTKLMEAMSRSPYLSHYREPSVISTTTALTKSMTVKFACEVNPLDTAK